MSDNDTVGINVGSKISKHNGRHVAKSIASIFKEGRKYSHDQETIRLAIEILGKSVSIDNVSVSGCSITGPSKTINIDGENI